MVLRITWHDVCFTWKPSKNAKDSFPIQQNRLRQLDMKVVADYLIPSTTHLVSDKRNTASGLQALINAKHIVTPSYVDAVVNAAQSRGLEDDDETPLPSALEEDFDRNWPDAMAYLPDPGTEPVPRPAEKFAPDPIRLEVFKGFTFIFGDKKQYNSLMAPITNGHGKCLLNEVKLGETDVEEFAEYVRKTADWKGTRTGEFEDGKNSGVTVVRFRGQGDTFEWALEFLRDLDGRLEQRSAEQNEFLDAIIMNDTRQLRAPLRVEADDSASVAPPATATSETRPLRRSEKESREEPTDVPSGAEEAAAAPSDQPDASDDVLPPAKKRRTARVMTKSRFKDFDDFDDFVPKRSPSPEPQLQSADAETQQPPTSAQVDRDEMQIEQPESQSQGMFVRDSPPAESISRKRKAPSPALKSTERELPAGPQPDRYDDLLPGAAAMKRRRLAEEAAGIRPEAAATAPEKAKPKPKPKKEIDVRSLARQHAQSLDRRAAKSGKVNFEANLDDPGVDVNAEQDDFNMDEDVSKLRDLAIVEEMPVREARGARSQAAGGHDSRWKPEWNGRKNFKKFRRQGDKGGAERGAKVIVRLEEVKKKDFGSDNFFLEDSGDERSRPRSNRHDTEASSGRNGGSEATSVGKSQSQTQSQMRTARGRRLQIADGSDDDDEEIVDESASAGRSKSSAMAGRKRPAAGDIGAPAAKKRQSRLRRSEDEDSEEDDMKFRFRSRRK